MSRQWNAEHIEVAKDVFDSTYSQEPDFLVDGTVDDEPQSMVVCHIGERSAIVQAIRELFEMAIEQAKALEEPKPITIRITHPAQWIEAMNDLTRMIYTMPMRSDHREEMKAIAQKLHSSIKE